LYVGVETPVAPEDREAYSYKITEKGFELCATFAYPSQNPDIYSYPADVSSELTKTMLSKVEIIGIIRTEDIVLRE
jgi:hypothetical protein